MKNFKRAAAILGVVVLLAVCCLPMIFAFGSGDNAQGNFKAAVGTVILVPVLAYVFLMVYKLLKKENKEAEGEVKNIIFDVGQVLVSYDWESYLKAFHFSAEEEKLIAEKVFKSQIWNERDRGLFPEEEYRKQFIAELPAEYEADVKRVIEESGKTIGIKDYAETWTSYLKSQGYEVSKAGDGIEGLEVLKKEKIHLAIVDVMMPRMDGIHMVMRLRKEYDFPVIMLSAKSEEVDKIMGLNMGADDYVTKPFQPMELLARVNSHLRRYARFMQMANARDEEQNQNVYTIRGLELNENTREVRVDGELVKMTPIEFKILSLLIRNPGRVFSADEIYERVWNESAINTDTVMVHVRNIREKIEYNPKEPKYLKVVWGVGYKIEKNA